MSKFNSGGIPLDSVIPWGRTYVEYTDMFALTDGDLGRRIVGVADGPASFCAGLAKRGGDVVAVDPLYRLAPDAIRERFDMVRGDVMTKLHDHYDDYDWNRFGSPEGLEAERTQAMERFLTDFANRKRGYVTGELPNLPFKSETFDIALCSHFLFTYAHLLDLRFHLESIAEMLRIAREVRVFPMITTEGDEPRWFDDLMDLLWLAGARADIIEVDYRFQRGAETMLRIRR